jgi:hypothetical protein
MVNVQKFVPMESALEDVSVLMVAVRRLVSIAIVPAVKFAKMVFVLIHV